MLFILPFSFLPKSPSLSCQSVK